MQGSCRLKIRRWRHKALLKYVLESTEWEAVKSNILEIGMTKGREIGFQIGRAEGREEGREEKLKEQISRKIQKGKSAEIIAVELEEDINIILPLYHQLISTSS